MQALIDQTGVSTVAAGWSWRWGVVVLALLGATLAAPAAGVPPITATPIDDDTVSLRWVHEEPGYVLQESDSPSGASPWYGIPVSPTIDGSSREVIRDLAPGQPRQFFRLRPRGVQAGLDYLLATQDSSGMWSPGAGISVRDTACAIEVLGLLNAGSAAVARGLPALAGSPVRNHDDRARRAMAVASSGGDVSGDVSALLEGQNSAVSDSTAVTYPGLGWGLAAGFGSSTIDTALVQAALRSSGRVGGLAVGRETVAVGSTTASHTFDLPAGATDAYLRVRSIAGARVRFLLTPPGSGPLFVELDPRTTPINVGPLPSLAGLWTLQVQNLGAVVAMYAAEVGFTGADGFDSFRLTTPLIYLARTQNADGGWGIGAGQVSHLMITAEVLRNLAGAGDQFVGPSVFGQAVAWLLARQNPDGGFGSVSGTSNLGETVAAVNALKAASPGTSLTAALAYLRQAQRPDGSWGASPFLTAGAIKALANGPLVNSIADQSVTVPTPFASIPLDDIVVDADHPDAALNWTVSGNQRLAVTIADRVATIFYPAGTAVTEVLTFTAHDPDGLRGSASVTFRVNVASPVDLTVARGGSVTGTRRFAGEQALLDQAASYQHTSSGIPAGVRYSEISLARPTPTEFEVGFRLAVDGSAPVGDYEFQVLYELFDEFPPLPPSLGPLTGNLFNFRIRVTP